MVRRDVARHFINEAEFDYLMEFHPIASMVISKHRAIDIKEHYQHCKIGMKETHYEMQSLDHFIETQLKIGFYFCYNGKYYEKPDLMDHVQTKILQGDIDICERLTKQQLT